MKELTLRLDPALAQALDDLADAQDRLPEEVAEYAVRRYLHDEGARRSVPSPPGSRRSTPSC
ncbi:hypothetical protein [Streptomyces sp. NPDC090798]|uniref:hypothetical protein n=1 Tax=Streptomyces sp. NPDC090798 TaxID=3365968 RepID=UPI0038031B6E